VAIKRVTETTLETAPSSLNVTANIAADGTVAGNAPLSAEDTVTLELELYQNYTIHGEVYTKGTPYRFLRADAMHLLAERDLNRPVWRIYRPAPVIREKVTEVVDATRRTVPTEFVHGVPLETRRIEVGDDSEIADILTSDDENVTV
jgi:hypothetical protein